MSTEDARAARRREHDDVTPQPVGRARHVLACVVLIAATCLLYAGAFGTGWFEIDDALYVPENPLLKSLSAANLGRMLSEPYFGNYSPAHLVSYAVDAALGGLDPFVFHLSNALWAGACAAGVWALAVRLTGSARAAWIAALLFVLHPAHVEAVAWIASRKDLVAAAFAIPATIAYFEYRERARSGRSGRTAYALSLALFLVATAGKLSVVVLPGAWVAFDLLVEGRRLVASALDKLPFVAIVVFFGLRAASAQPATNVDVGASAALQIGGWLVWLLTGLGDYVIFRPVPDASASALTVAVLGALFVAFVAGPWLFVRRALAGDRTVGLVLSLHAWLVLALLPSQVLGFVYPVSDRYLFFPSVPLALALALAAERARRGGTLVRAGTAVLLVALACVWGWKSWSGVRSWADPRSVFHAQARAVSDVNAHEYLALHYLRCVDALVDPRPDPAHGPSGLPARTLDLARALGIDADVLTREWSTAVPRRPATDALIAKLLDRAWREVERAAAIETPRSLPSLYYRRGRILDLRGDPRAALGEFERAEREARIHPIEDVARTYRVQSLYSQALMSERLGDAAAALARMREAQVADPTFADVGAQVRRLEARSKEEGG